MASVTRESMSDAEFARSLLRKFDEYQEHYEAGRLGDDAPCAAEIVNLLSAGVRAGRAAAAGRDEPAESNIDPMAADDPANFSGKPRSPFEMNNSPTVDARPLTVDEAMRLHTQAMRKDAPLFTVSNGMARITRVLKNF